MNPDACNRRMRRGWWCSRPWAHLGPCALRPRWWNLRARFEGWGR